MVGIASWADGSITSKDNIKWCTKLARKACEDANISLQEIGIVIFSGVYRPNFRSEPSCASHIQSKLNIRCTDLELSSKHCFSFDIIDGSRGAHRAIQTAGHFIEKSDAKYALVVCADVKPSKQCEWPYQNHALAMILSGTGDGIRYLSGEFSGGTLMAHSKSSFDLKKKVPIIKYFGDPKCSVEINSKTEFVSNSAFLGSVQMRNFLLWSNNKNGELKHTIVDRAGSMSITHWRA